MTGRIVVATTNRGKLAEFAEALAPAGVEVVGLDALGPVPTVEETGATFEQNARLKADTISRRTDLPVVADDSGLEVDALDGAPGVLSARYGGAGLTDADRCRALLAAMEGVPEARRTARFRCVLAVARAGRTIATYEGVADGLILTEPRGTGGFGYDPVFFHPPSAKTFAELTTAEKRSVSHRGKALAKMGTDSLFEK